MRISQRRIVELQRLLDEHHGLSCTDEEAQVIGLAIMRFVLAKKLKELAIKETINEQ